MADPEIKPDKNQEAPKVAPAAAPAAAQKAPADRRAEVTKPAQADLGVLKSNVGKGQKIFDAVPDFGKTPAAETEFRDIMQYVVIPGKGWDDLQKLWMDEAVANLKKTPTAASLKAAFAPGGHPGPFGEWLKSHADKNKFALWEARETSRTGLETGKKQPLLESLDAKINGLHEDFAALKAEAEAQRKALAEAPASDISNLEGKAKSLEKFLDEAAAVHATFVAVSKGIEGLNHGKDVLKPERDRSENLLKAVKDEGSLKPAEEAIATLQARLGRWQELEEAEKNPALPSERRDEILNAAKTNNKSPEDALTAIRQAIKESETVALAQTGEEPGLYDTLTGLLASFNLNIENPTFNKTMLKLAAALSAIPFIGKMIRGALFNRVGLLHMARAGGDKQSEARYTHEVNALGLIRKYGISATVADQLMDLNAASFARIQPSTITKNDAERLAILKLQQNFSGSGLTVNPNDPIWKIIGSPEWSQRVKTPPAAPQNAVPEKTPEQQTDDLLTGNLNFTPDQTVKVKELGVADVLQGKATYPDGTPDDKKAKLKAVLEKNIPQSERAKVKPETKVAQFFENRYQNKLAVEI